MTIGVFHEFIIKAAQQNLSVLHSIEALDRGNIIDTQNRPIIVHASDLNFYYCKYHTYTGSANRLFKEYLVASLLKCWNLNQSTFSLIKVLPEHIPIGLTIPKDGFDVPCFGLQKVEDVFDVTKITEDILLKSKYKSVLQDELLKIAFFDIWICNEDRHINNYNLLSKFVNGEYRLYPIDHEACFNSQNLENELIKIDYTDSLIYSTLFYKSFTVSDIPDNHNLAGLKRSFYLCVECCRQNININLQDIPPEWSINLEEKSKKLNQYLLTDIWFEDCWNTFLQYLRYFTS